MTEQPETDYVYSGRKTVGYPPFISDLWDNRISDYLAAQRFFN